MQSANFGYVRKFELECQVIYKKNANLKFNNFNIFVILVAYVVIDVLSFEGQSHQIYKNYLGHWVQGDHMCSAKFEFIHF